MGRNDLPADHYNQSAKEALKRWRFKALISQYGAHRLGDALFIGFLFRSP
jgi:hypothetical protein